MLQVRNTEKSMQSRGLTLGYNLGDGGHSQLDAKLLDAMKRIQREYHDEDFGVGDASSLLVKILAEPFPPKIKLPNLDKYDGKSGPRIHLANFCTTMLL